MIFSTLRFVLASICSLVFFMEPAYGQTSASVYSGFVKQVRKAYGLDHGLINGTQYYNRHTSSQGDPYFLNPVYRSGSLTQEGHTYTDLFLRFDIHAQQVELRYQNFSGGGNELITVADKLEAFTLGTYQFRKMALGAEEEKIYQVLPNTCFTCYIHWEKELIPLTGSFTYTSEFSEAKKSLWLEVNGKLHKFSSRKDFYGLFPDASRKEIKRLLSRNQFKFRTAGVDAIIRNLNSVCRLLEEQGSL